MLARYKIYRGRRPDDDPLPHGVRMDTRKHTQHCLRPDKTIVDAYLAAVGDDAFETFRAAYQAAVQRRYAQSAGPFDELADLARRSDVFLGCNCPTKKNPDVDRCHTRLALEFMRQTYPDLEVAAV